MVANTTNFMVDIIKKKMMFHDNIKVFPQFIKKILREHDLSGLALNINTTQTEILMFIYENSDKTMSELSSMVGLDKSSFTRSVDSLVNRGFITKKDNHLDKRKIYLSLTDTGLAAAKGIKDEYDNYLESLLSGFSKEEKADFLFSLNTVSKYINKIIDMDKNATGKKPGYNTGYVY